MKQIEKAISEAERSIKRTRKVMKFAKTVPDLEYEYAGITLNRLSIICKTIEQMDKVAVHIIMQEFRNVRGPERTTNGENIYTVYKKDDIEVALFIPVDRLPKRGSDLPSKLLGVDQ